MDTALDGIRVIDATSGPAGGLATMVLADFGADVVKVEPPGGDRFRALAASPLWLRGKRSVTADLRSDSGRAQLCDLVAGADVLVVGGPPSRARRWGVDFSAAARLQPTIVHCSITGWGEQGPLAEVPGHWGAVAARTGRMRLFAGQLPRPGPVYAAVPVAVHAAAHGAVQGIVSALLARRRRPGLGAQQVCTSLLQATLPYDLLEMLVVQIEQRTGTRPKTTMMSGGDMPTLNYHPVRAADGSWIQCGNLLEHLFLSFLDAIDLYGELLADPRGRFAGTAADWSPEAVEEARDRILTRMLERPAAEWMSLFAANGNVAAEIVAGVGAAIDHPDLRANGAVVEIDDPQVGPVEMVGATARLSATPAVVRAPAPAVGAQNEGKAPRVPRLAAAAGPAATSAGVTAPPRGRPLDGVRVVEIAAVIAAPLGVSMLADLGADVVRVEPLDGDPYRELAAHGMPAVKTTAGKRSICADLKTAEGREIVQRLLATADVLVHNYRPGVPERLGIGYEQLRERYPRLVWVAVTGYGPDGPGAARPATHPVAGAAMGGVAYQAGAATRAPADDLAGVREGARQIMRANDPNPDPNTAVVVASSTVVALYARERTGQGQAVQVDMLTANAHANADGFVRYAGSPGRPALDPEQFGVNPRYRLYPARTGWVFLAATGDDEWKRFCAVAEVSSDAEIGPALLRRDAAEWEERGTAAGVACVVADATTPGPFNLAHPQVIANGFAPEVVHARFGPMRRWGPLVTVDGGMDRYGPGALAGEHTDAILAGLGYGDDAIADLRARRIVASEETAPLV